MLLTRPFKVAVTVVLPAATAVATPEALIVAAAGFEDAQVAVVVESFAVPSL